nr:uncharacterized protein LOC109147524 [Ipomoea batatas]
MRLYELISIYIPTYSYFKRKLLKSPLKRLNKEEFGHISERAVRANEDYSSFAQNYDVITASEEDRIMLQNLRNRACYLAEAEKQFFYQKLKLKSLIDGDKGTKYFHDLVKKSNRDKSITCVLDENDEPTTSLTQVGALFVNYFKSLFGVSCDRIPCNPTFIQNGPLVTDSQHHMLTCEVSAQEIKDALFDIDDLKAPGPDGFSAAFFKNNWDILGDDLIKAVQEFFVSGQLLKQINYTTIALIPKSQQAQKVWAKIRDIIGFPKKTIAIRSTIKWIHRLYKGSRKQNHGVAIALACSVYHVWRFRNLVVHEAVVFNLDGLVKLFVAEDGGEDGAHHASFIQLDSGVEGDGGAAEDGVANGEYMEEDGEESGERREEVEGEDEENAIGGFPIDYDYNSMLTSFFGRSAM